MGSGNRKEGVEVDRNIKYDKTSIHDDGNSNIGDQDTMQVDQNSDSEDGNGIRVTIGVEGDDEVIQEKHLPPPTCCSSIVFCLFYSPCLCIDSSKGLSEGYRRL
jgi:hypothetical protein